MNARLASGRNVALLLVVLAVALRCVDFGNPVIHVDEQYYLLVGDRMLHGALPYVDLWDRKPLGLFVLFAAMRLLPGDGILAYQLVATGFAAATAWLIWRGARAVGALPRGAFASAFAYLIWCSLLSGRGGQSPIFYDLFVAAAAVLTLRLPSLAEARRTGAILASGTLACALLGLAIQTKYTPAIEAAYMGAAHLWYLRRAGAGPVLLAGAAVLWIVLGIAPTAAAIGVYWAKGPAVFGQFWFSNFTSISLRHGYPAAKIAGRLAGTGAQLLPLIACAVLSWRARPRPVALLLAYGWLAAALVAWASIGAFFDHYALPLLAPLGIVAAPTLGRSARAVWIVLGIGLAIFAAKTLTRHADAAGAYAIARVVEANDRGGCPYVFTGDSATYLLAHACIPTAYAFPSTLAYEPERGATGIDEAGEVARIMAARPPVVVEGSRPLADWNVASEAVMHAALARDYRPVFSAPRDDYRIVVYLRRDLRMVSR